MNALVAQEAKVQPALRVQARGPLRVVSAEPHEAQGQETGDLGTALGLGHALGRSLVDRLHRIPF